jgi:hypothetical protein
MEVLGDLSPILEASGIQLPNIDGVMSDEQRRTSLASTATRGGLSYPVFMPKPSTHRMYDPGSIVPHI